MNDSASLATDREWLLADGAGGFAMGPDGGPPTRRYHAWSIAAVEPPVRRTVTWRGAAEWWEPEPESELEPGAAAGGATAGGRHEASCHRFAAADGSGPGLLAGPRPEPAEIDAEAGTVGWTTRLPGLDVVRQLAIAEGVARMRWELRRAGDMTSPGRWCVRPFTPLIPFHGLLQEFEGPPELEPVPGGVRLRRGDVVVVLAIAGDRSGFRLDPQWWHRFALEHERARGQDWVADEWSPGVAMVPVDGDQPVVLEMTVAVESPGDAAAVPPSAAPAPPTARPAARTHGRVEARLDASAAAFVVRRGRHRSIIAGYPWFADWGRDALISLPGLLPPGERDEDAVSVLEALAAHRRDGLLPNCFHDETGANDHAADTGPWFLRTVAGYAAAPGGRARVAAAGLFDAAADVVDAVVAGTRHGIRLDDDGLVTAGEPGGPAVTWMDAMRGGIAFTPRHGKAVEINALWIEGLRGLSAVEPDEARATRYAALADAATSGFAAFAWPERGCLVDRLESRDPRDPAAPVDRPARELRPNQLIAAACPAVPLDAGQRAGIVAACRAVLLTPFGLRTLEPADPAYIGRYEGDLMQRDAAYHQGTVWPWLLGPFVDAMFLAAEPAEHPAVARQAARDLAPLLETLDRGCRGHVAEIYDGDDPQRPDGCPAQAWSMAELRRVMRRIAAAGG